MACSVGYSRPINFLVDSGADVNVLSQRDWECVESQARRGTAVIYDVNLKPTLDVCPYGSNVAFVLACTLKAWLETTTKPKPRVFADFVVVRNSQQSILGRKTAIKMKLLAVGLEVNLLSETPVSEFPSVPGIEIEFDVDASVAPVRHVYVSIPAHYKEPAMERLRAMEASGIIERVRKAPRWISGLSAVPKGRSNFRLVVNMRGPNRAIRRQFHAMPRVEEIKIMLNGAKWFTKLDLTSAFHHVKLAEQSRELTTFMGPDGMYRFTRLVFGVNCAPEIFQRIMEDVLHGISNIVIYIDDILIYAVDNEELQEITGQVHSALNTNNLTLNKDKCEYAKQSLTFLGHQITPDGLNIDEKKVESIRKFTRPKTFSELKSFLGLASYVSTFISRFSDMTEPLWRVAQKDTFEWGEEQEEAFVAVRSAIINCTTTQGYFDVTDRTFLYTDASPRALGAVLVQRNSQGVDRIVSFASKTLTKVERRYAQTQREALAVVWGSEHFFFYLLGHKFTIRTDAEGIAFIINRRGDEPKRMMRRAEGWAMRLDAFDFDVEVIKGLDNIADPSSRLYEGDDGPYEEEVAPGEILSLTADCPEEIKFGEDYLTVTELAYGTTKDKELREVMIAIEFGVWPRELDAFAVVQEELDVSLGVVVRAGLAVVPRVLRAKALHLAHKGHPGMTKMKSILRERVWWPGMSSAVETWVKSCFACTLNGRGEPPTPMQRTRLPDAPWEFLALDFCGPYQTADGTITIIGLVDYHSRYLMTMPLRHNDMATVRAWLNSVFDTFGLPTAVKSDNGPPFNSHEWRQFCTDRGINCVFSWPLTPQQNGTAERAMATIGKAMKSAAAEKSDYKKVLAEAVRAHNASEHRVTGEIPENVMFGRRMRRALPLMRPAPIQVDVQKMRERDQSEKEKAKTREDAKRRARPSEITVGDKVVVQRDVRRKGETNFDPTEFTVMSQRAGDITMQAEDGRVMRRNVTKTRKLQERLHDEQPGEPAEQPSVNDEQSQRAPEHPVNTSETAPEQSRDQIGVESTRPRRMREPPRHLRDYIMMIDGER